MSITKDNLITSERMIPTEEEVEEVRDAIAHDHFADMQI